MGWNQKCMRSLLSDANANGYTIESQRDRVLLV